MIKRYLPLAALAVFGLTSVASAARNMNSQRGDVCAPSGPAVCYPDDCTPCQRCLGPDNFAGNPPACPLTCNGDVTLTVAAFYWSSHLDGMEYAIVNHVQNPYDTENNVDVIALNHLVDAEYKHPNSNWDWGFKIGAGYCSPCDGWDVNLQWTWFRNTSRSHLDYGYSSNASIIPLWSNFVTQFADVSDQDPITDGSAIAATDATSNWKLDLYLVDFELGRAFWVSRYLNIRPFVGVRYASIEQKNQITYNGGAWSQFNLTVDALDYSQPALNDYVRLKNDYHGAGLRAGLGSEWNFGCGWALYGNLAASIVYGKFTVRHKEKIRQATNTPHNHITILDADESLRASRAILDMTLGVQWSTMFCSCKYGFTAMLGWEQHTFFDQNQMWRVDRVGAEGQPNTRFTGLGSPVPIVTGDNVIQHRRGSLDTQGWTFTVKLDF